MDPIAVALAGIDADQVTVPDEAGALWKVDEALVAAGVEEAQLDFGGDLREKREVRTRAVVGGPEGILIPEHSGLPAPYASRQLLKRSLHGGVFAPAAT